MIKSNKLNNGDKVAVVSLSSGILGESFMKHELDLGIKRLKEFGLIPVFTPNSLKGLECIKNNPDARARDLKWAFDNKEIKAIICAIGGEDTYRTIPYLMEDNDFIDSVKKNPKIFIGFSDTTINHLMFYKLGLVTLYGNNFLCDLAELDKNMLPYSYNSFLNLFRNDKGIEIKSSDVWYEERTKFGVDQLETPRISHMETKGYEVINGSGTIEGELYGGCIESLYELVSSSKYSDAKDICERYNLFPKGNFWDNKILFIETSELNSTPEEYTKMLDTLGKYEVFERVKGILVGKPQNEKYYEEYKKILKNKIPVPIMVNVNFGHAYPRTIIPYGIKAKVDLDKKNIILIDNFLN